MKLALFACLTMSKLPRPKFNFFCHDKCNTYISGVDLDDGFMDGWMNALYLPYLVAYLVPLRNIQDHCFCPNKKTLLSIV